MKSTDRILAKRYARAFDALSKNGEEASRRAEALRAAERALRGARAYMEDPAVPSEDKKAFITQILGQEKAVAGFMLALLDAKRYYLLNACVQDVLELLDQRLGVVRARVQTAFELSEAQKKRVEEALGRFAGKKAEAEFETEPALLGGVRARMGDVLIDGSLKNQFEKLQEELTK